MRSQVRARPHFVWMISAFVIPVELVTGPDCPTATQAVPTHETSWRPPSDGRPDGFAPVVQVPPVYVWTSGLIGEASSPAPALVLAKLVERAPTATQLTAVVHDTPCSPVATSVGLGFGLETGLALPLVTRSVMGPDPFS